MYTRSGRVPTNKQPPYEGSISVKVIVKALDDGGAYIAALEPTTDEHRKSLEIQKGEKLELILPGVDNVDGIEFGEVTPKTEESGEPEPAAPADDAPPSGDGSGEGGDQGEGGKAPEDAPPTTSAASEKPLYLVSGDQVPDGFEPSGLETPDGKTLYHFAGDTAGQASTGNVDAVSVYAEADDNDKPVKAPDAEAGGAGGGESSDTATA